MKIQSLRGDKGPTLDVMNGCSGSAQCACEIRITAPGDVELELHLSPDQAKALRWSVRTALVAWATASDD